MSIILAILLAGLGAPDVPTLQPTGPWVVEGEDNMCALLHAYGPTGRTVTFGVRPWPLGGSTDILLFTPSNDEEVTRGMAQIRLEPGGATGSGDYVGYALQGKQQRMTSFTVDADTAAQLMTAREAIVTIGRATTHVALPDATKAGAALASCSTTLLKALNIDREAYGRAAEAPEPIGNNATWFTSSDYPEDAARGGAQAAPTCC